MRKANHRQRLAPCLLAQQRRSRPCLSTKSRLCRWGWQMMAQHGRCWASQAAQMQPASAAAQGVLAKALWHGCTAVLEELRGARQPEKCAYCRTYMPSPAQAGAISSIVVSSPLPGQALSECLKHF